MIRIVAFALLLAACTSTPVEAGDTSTTTERFRVDVASDVWTGEVEWDLVERCALRGLSDCANLVVSLREADCTVEGAIRYLEGMGMADVRSDVVEGLHEIGDCPGLDLVVP